MLTARPRIVAALAFAAGLGIALDVAVPGVRTWLWNHTFTTGILVGLLLIAATYLVVEQALEERERRRWSEAARPLMQAIATAGAGTDAELRAGLPEAPQCEWLAQLLERYQVALTGTPELIEHWHAALSLAQHARAARTTGTPGPGPAYDAAWARFCSTFGDVQDFSADAPDTGATWSLPAVRPGQTR